MLMMFRKVRSTTSLYFIGTLVFLASIYYNFTARNSLPTDDNHLLRLAPVPVSSINPSFNYINNIYNQLVDEKHLPKNHYKTDSSPPPAISPSPPLVSQISPPPPSSPLISQPPPSPSISTVGILLPGWQVLVVVSPHDTSVKSNSSDLHCLFPDHEASPASPSVNLPSPYRKTFTCELPNRIRRRLPFPEPMLVTSQVVRYPARDTPVPNLLRWDFIVYDVFFSDNDVVLFVKGVNRRQGINREPHEFSCIFGDDLANGVRTAVTSSLQEVFRCQRPKLTALPSSTSSLIKVSLEFSADKRVIPSIAYGNPAPKVAPKEPKSQLCACTMVYNVAKFLKEWVIYHSKIGVDKFILYDNGSDDDLYKIVDELVKAGYNVSRKFWLWPKTQEGGFSHCAISSKNSCTWMMFVDVDEFLYADSWAESTSPSKSMLQSFLPNLKETSQESKPKVGEVMIGCHEFGPSNQKSHPVMGVMQGYNCRKQMENRHKSIVLLDAISDSLLNVVHHFELKEGYKVKKMNAQNVVINHYKFQAWPVFKDKFKRRVSAYVVDWTQNVNLNSNDRTPGLGFSAVEPKGWPQKFCEVHDDGLKELTEKWFRVETPSGYRMVWQR